VGRRIRESGLIHHKSSFPGPVETKRKAYEQTGVPVIKANRHTLSRDRHTLGRNRHTLGRNRHTLGRKVQQILHRYMQPLPEMHLRCDRNGIPISANCSKCSVQMPHSSPRITNPIDNIAWFGAQFSEHLAQYHPPTEPLKSTFGRLNQERRAFIQSKIACVANLRARGVVFQSLLNCRNGIRCNQSSAAFDATCNVVRVRKTCV
jgi:hypothetical protein